MSSSGDLSIHRTLTSISAPTPGTRRAFHTSAEVTAELNAHHQDMQSLVPIVRPAPVYAEDRSAQAWHAYW